jgi:hypothetical protein
MKSQVLAFFLVLASLNTTFAQPVPQSKPSKSVELLNGEAIASLSAQENSVVQISDEAARAIFETMALVTPISEAFQIGPFQCEKSMRKGASIFCERTVCKGQLPEGLKPLQHNCFFKLDASGRAVPQLVGSGF